MASTYEPIATQTLGSATTSVTFSSIPSTYTDIVAVLNTKTASNVSTYMNFNGDTAGNYSFTRIYGNGSSAVSDRVGTNMTGIDIQYVGSGDGNITIVNIMNYANTTTYKSSLTRWNTQGSTGYVGANVNLWRSTAAISSIVFSNSVNFSIGSTFTLYGIKAA